MTGYDALPPWRRRWRTVQAVLATAVVLLAAPFMLGAAVFQKHLLLIPIGLMTLLAVAHLLGERMRRRRLRRTGDPHER